MNREELLRSARNLYKNPGTNEALKVVLEETYPELKEREDERIRKELLALVRMNVLPEATCLVRGGSVTRAQAEAYLERQKKQKPAEWSEEDEDMRDTIIRDLKRLGGDIVNVKPAYKAEIDWLKSLRPQSHWKPSEEQMKVLKAAIVYVESSESNFKWSGSVLESLYNDLKSL